jgi:hypothetical protein
MHDGRHDVRHRPPQACQATAPRCDNHRNRIMTRIRSIPTTAAVVAIAAVLAGCASGLREDAAFLRPADRPECQLSSSTDRAPQGQVASLDHQRCHPGDQLEWSSGQRDTIKPDFSGKRDD